MSWRVAESLEVLRAEINKAAPSRSIISDGSIGDAAHASRSSDHNPWVVDFSGQGVVRARDFTHDPNGGLNCDTLAADLRKLLGQHPALGSGAYIIWEGAIVSTDRLSEGWRPYFGSNAHTKHLHVSVGTSGYDSAAAWDVLNRETVQEDDMAQHDAQLDRIERLAEQAANQARRAREGSYNRDKRIEKALDELIETTGKTARKTQVAAIKALIKEQGEEEA